MTQKETYWQLQKRVYEIIYPKGISLEFGCEVITNQYKHMGVCTLIKPDLQKDWLVLLNGNTLYQNEKEFKILGKHLSLQEVLRTLSIKPYVEKDINISYMISYLPVLEIETGDDINDLNYDLFRIDLTKEIKDQDQEVLEKIYQLIK